MTSSQAEYTLIKLSLNPPNNHNTMLRYIYDDDILLCYTVKHFFYIPPVLVVWQHTTSQTREFAAAEHNIEMDLRMLDCGDENWVQLIQNRDCWFSFVMMMINLP
jgi:hypothetical protein